MQPASTNNIVFTSRNDNSCGDTTAGFTGSSSHVDWYGIYFYGQSDYEGTGNFDYYRIRYGGNTATVYDANIGFDRRDEGYFTNSISE